MITPKFRDLLEQFHRSKWFPGNADSFQEFSDYVSEGMIRDLLEHAKKENDPSIFATAEYIARILPTLQYRDLHEEFRSALRQPLRTGVLPESAYYYIRSLPDNESKTVWRELQSWCEEWDTVLRNWLHIELASEKILPEHWWRISFEKELRESRELFAWKLQEASPGARTLADLLFSFRWKELDTLADWQDLTALAKAVVELHDVRKSPALEKAENDAIQFLFPVDPPLRVILQHGKTAGPVDALRFLHEFGRGLFYCAMDPDLPFEKRICGDAALPYFWGFVHASILTDRECLQSLIRTGADAVFEKTSLVLEFWFRYDSFLALYRAQSRENFQRVNDSYAENFELAFPVQPPSFLYLYDLNRSYEASSRATALHAASRAVERLRELYGKRWFTNPRFGRRFRDYCWMGFTLTLQDVLRDLGVN